MSNESATRVVRYETIIATLVGVSALFVSGYTAYVQRQQVRAAVWPILEYNTSNEPQIKFVVENKGVGPAIVRHVLMKVDGQPVRTWTEAFVKLMGPGRYLFSLSTVSSHVFAAGESMDILVPHGSDGGPLTLEKDAALRTALDKERFRVEMEICYCSTLGECWILRSGPAGTSTTETRTCPAKSGSTFQQ
ncbi:MAG TPA: hypothetical protein VJU77_15755 [Chthoniobacterales bacterium]|nr:hypothetical protein [Chthoniobacterales bacterium]